MPTKQLLDIGPWPLGVNSIQSETRLRDDELVRANNFEVDERGYLYTRRFTVAVEDFDKTVTTNTSHLLGTIPIKVTDGFNVIQVEDAGAYSYNDSVYAIWANADGVAKQKIFDGPTYGFDQTSIGYFRHIFAYNNKYYLLSSDPAVNSYWADIQGDLSTLTWNIINTGPFNGQLYAETYVIYLDRLYVGVGSEVWFSTAYDFLNWITDPEQGGDSNFIEIGTRTGEEIKTLHIQSGSLYVLTSDGIWQISFSISPTEDGATTQLNQNNILMALYHNDRLFCICPDGLYIFINNTLYRQPVNTNLNFSACTGLFGLLDYLVICHSDPDIDGTVLCMNLNTGAFTQWTFDQFPSPFANEIIYTNVRQTKNFNFSTPTLGSTTWVLFRFRKSNEIAVIPYHYERIDKFEFYDSYYDVGQAKTLFFPYEQSLWTKEYDFGVNFRYKRVFYGTADMNVEGHADGTIVITDLLGRSNLYSMNILTPYKFRYQRTKLREVGLDVLFRPTARWSVDPTLMTPVEVAGRVNCQCIIRNLALVYEYNDVQRGALV